MFKKYRDDHELIYLISQNDDEALEELINKYKGLMIKSFSDYESILKNNFDRYELYQISLISLYHAVQTYKEVENCSFITYLRLIVHRDILLYIRNLYRQRSVSNMNTVSLDQSVSDAEGIYLVDLIESNQPEFDPTFCFERKEQKQKIDQIIQSLDEEERIIFTKWRDGYRYDEIASQLNITKKRVDNKIQKIKRKFRRLFDYEDSL